MLTDSMEGNSDSEQLRKWIHTAIDSLLDRRLSSVKCRVFQDTIRANGQPLRTGKNTLLLELNDGSPEVDVMIDSGNCCGD